MSSVYVFGTLLTASGQLRTLNWIAVSGALLNILLNFWLINSFAAFGAVIATLVTQSLVAIIHVAVAYRQFSLQSSWIDTLKLIVFAAAIVVLFAIVAHLISIWWLGLMLGILGSGAMLLALHIFRYQDFMALLKVRATS